MCLILTLLSCFIVSDIAVVEVLSSKSFHISCEILAEYICFCSANVFGVSTESMQLSFDSRGNSVPTILLMMQRRLYEKGGLQVCYCFTLLNLCD